MCLYEVKKAGVGPFESNMLNAFLEFEKVDMRTLVSHARFSRQRIDPLMAGLGPGSGQARLHAGLGRWILSMQKPRFCTISRWSLT